MKNRISRVLRKASAGAVFPRKTVAERKLISGYSKDVYSEFLREKTALLKFFKDNNILEELSNYSKKEHPELYEKAKKKKPSKKDIAAVNRLISGWEKNVKPEEMQKVFADWNKKAGNLGGEAGLKKLGVSIAFHLKDKKILKQLKKRGIKITGFITKKTLKDFRKILVSSYMEKGLTPYDVRNQIKGLFDETYKHRAMTIARTETGVARGIVQHATYVKNKIEMKEWSAVVDDRTRPSHDWANGQVVRIDEPFDVMGSPMMHPLDGNAPPSEVINCRCDEYPVFVEKPADESIWSGG